MMTRDASCINYVRCPSKLVTNAPRRGRRPRPRAARTSSRPRSTRTCTASASTSRRSPRELGLGRTTIYRWFGSREGLDRRGRRPGSRAALRRGARSATRRGGRIAPRHVRPDQPRARSGSGAPQLPRARARRAPDPDLERGPCSRAWWPRSRATSRTRCERGLPAGRGSRDPRVRDRAARGGVPLQRRDRGVRGDVDRLREIEAALLGVPLPTPT